MWTQKSSREWPVSRIAINACLAVAVIYAGYSIWQRINRLREVDIECAKLDPEAIKLAAAKLYVNGLSGGSVTMQDKNGEYTETYPLYPFTLEEFLEKHPDCCRYYPGELRGQKLPSRWRLEGKCGSAELSARRYYIKDGQIIERGASGRTWFVDTNMNFQHASN